MFDILRYLYRGTAAGEAAVRKAMKRSSILLAMVLVSALLAAPAFGSAIVGHNATRATLAIDRRGRAHVGYSSGGRRERLVAWGAIDARTPNRIQPQVRFRLRYGTRGGGVCLPYDGPSLAWLVKACKAPDGSYWALQSWQRLKPSYGGTAGLWELHLSHWRGALPQLSVFQNWTDGGVRHLFGRLTYGGQGVFGFSSTTHGNPLDSYGRNIYLDTFDSAYGRGWHRENGFLTHRRGHTSGDFCYAFYPHSGHPSGAGAKYRATVEGPGVTPDVMWEGTDIGHFNPTIQDQMRALERSWGDPKCRT